MDTIAQQVLDIVASQFCVTPSQIALATRLTEDLGADSLERIEIAQAIDDTFGVVVPDADTRRWLTVGDVVDDVRRRRSHR
jgi:acyl carrier protein